MQILLIFYSALIACAVPAQAAAINWALPVNATGNSSDILTTGTLFAARTTGPTTTVNGVTFSGGFSGPIVLDGVSGTSNIFSSPNFSNPNYNILLGAGAFNVLAGSITVSITGLTDGSQYAVQFFMPFWDSNWATAFTGDGSTSALVNATGPDRGAGASSVPQSIVGQFTASGSSQSITLSSPTVVNMLAAAQVRELGAVPEPASWAMLITGFGLIGAVLRRRRAVLA